MTNDGDQPAFPVTIEREENGSPWQEVCFGVSIRDYFAAAAMQGWMASYPGDQAHPAELQHSDALDCLAVNSYAVADAMLRERERKAS
jgi:hypothetical protein